MIHPLFTRLVTQPGLFAEHLGAYAELAGAEAQHWGRRSLKRGLLAALAVVAGTLALGLAGVSALLAAALPLQAMPAPWALWAVPLLPAVLALPCAIAARCVGKAEAEAFALLRRQMQADAELLQEAGHA